MVACLGIVAFGECAYQPLNPSTTYFSMGEGIATLALLFAVLNLIDDRFRFRLRILPWVIPVVVGLFLVGFAGTVVAALIPSFVQVPRPLIGYPIFWETSAALADCLGILILAVRFVWPPKFTPKRAGRYFRACFLVIGRGKQSELVDLANEIQGSIKAIVRTAGSVDWTYPPPQREMTRGEMRAAYAISTLDAFGDEQFCRNMVNHQPSTAELTLKLLLGEFAQERRWGTSLCSQIIRQAFLSEGSKLRKEKSYEGLGAFKSFQIEIFHPYVHTTSVKEPLRGWRYGHQAELEVGWFERYASCVHESFCGHFDKPRETHGFREQAAVFSEMLGCVAYPLWKVMQVNEVDDEALRESVPLKCVHIIARTLVECVQYMQEHDLQSIWGTDPDPHTGMRGPSVYQCLATAVFEFLAMLSSCDHGWRALRDSVVTIWWPIERMHSKKGGAMAGLRVQDLLAELLKERLTENFTEGAYAPITRPLVAAMGIRQQGYFGRELREVLSVAIASRTRVPDFLPDYMEWSDERGVFLNRLHPHLVPVPFERMTVGTLFGKELPSAAS